MPASSAMPTSSRTASSSWTASRTASGPTGRSGRSQPARSRRRAPRRPRASASTQCEALTHSRAGARSRPSRCLFRPRLDPGCRDHPGARGQGIPHRRSRRRPRHRRTRRPRSIRRRRVSPTSWRARLPPWLEGRRAAGVPQSAPRRPGDRGKDGRARRAPVVRRVHDVVGRSMRRRVRFLDTSSTEPRYLWREIDVPEPTTLLELERQADRDELRAVVADVKATISRGVVDAVKRARR
jgi:hypothetical protein